MRRPLQAIAIVCGGIFIAVLAIPGDARPQALGYGCSVFGRHPCAPAPQLCGVFNNGRPCLPELYPPIGEDLRLTITSTDQNDPANTGATTAPDNAASPGDDAKNGDAKHDDVKNDENKNDDAKEVTSIGAMYAALRACWVPPRRDEARHGMQYTVRFAFKRDGDILAPPRVTYASRDAPAKVRDIYRDAVNATLARCTPLHFSQGMGGAVAGRPIAVRFVDNRTAGNGKTGE
jgi:hypothetical protein